MIIDISRCRKIIAVLVLSTVFFQAHAQSRYMESGINGPGFRVGAAADESGIVSAGLSAGYSIGGIMDFGFGLSRNTNTLLDVDIVEWNYAFLYNMIFMKQSETSPMTFQVEGSYGYTNLTPDDPGSEGTAGTGQGFEVGGSLFRTFPSRGTVSFTLGIKGAYRNYLYSGFDDTVFTAPPPENRVLNFKWGGIAAVSFQTRRGSIFTMETEIFYNQTSGGFLAEPALHITSPVY